MLKNRHPIFALGLLPAALAALTALSAPTQAATPLTALRYTPDITVTLAGTTVSPNAVAHSDAAGSVPTLPLSSLPADLSAYWSTGTVHWFVFATTVALPGGITAAPRDVVSYDGSTYTKILDGATAGIPAGAVIDAVTSTTGSDFLISLDTTGVLGSVTAAPADLVRYNAGAWSAYFTGAAVGVPAGVNLDAAHFLDTNGHLLVSFDTAGTVGGVTFGAGDVLEYTAGPVWELAYSPAAVYPGWGAANLRGLWVQAAPPLPAGMLQFSAATYAGTEGGGAVTITVTRTGGSAGAVTVQYASTDGSATAPADYTAVSGTLTWADGDAAPKTFTVPIVDDALVEPSETLSLALAMPTGGASLGATANATLTIADNDVPPTPAGVLQFSAATYAGAEGGGAVTITVTRTGGSAGAVTVQYASTDGSATAPADYTAVSGTLTWADGDAAPKTFTVPIVDDALVEPSETLSLALAVPTGGASLGTTANATLTIADNETQPGGPGTMHPVPTLSQWALGLVALLLGLFTVLNFNRKEPQ